MFDKLIERFGQPWTAIMAIVPVPGCSHDRHLCVNMHVSSSNMQEHFLFMGDLSLFRKSMKAERQNARLSASEGRKRECFGMAHQLESNP